MRRPIWIALSLLVIAGAIVLLRARVALAPGPTHEPSNAPEAAAAAGHAAPAAPAASTTAAGPQAIPPKLPPSVTTEPAPAQGEAAEVPIRRTQRQLMGTIWMIGIAGGDETKTKIASERALDEVARLETILSEWKSDSEVSRVNANAGIAPVPVGDDMIACVKASLETARWSKGAFDISWAALRDLWDFSADSKHVPPSREAVKARLPLWNYRNIKLDEKKKTLFLTQKRMQIGLGGIAKGYALDRASESLQRDGFNDFMIFGGGQVLVHGKRGDRLWRVGIQNPRDSSYFGFVQVTDTSVSTSGDYEHSYFYNGKRYHHIIDPATGFPSEKTASVTVVAKSALWADAVDTAVFIMGPERGLAALAHTPAGAIEGITVDPELRVNATAGGAKMLMLSVAIDAEHHIGHQLQPGDPKPMLVPMAGSK